MDRVHKDQRPEARAAQALSSGHHSLDLFDPAEHRAERYELGCRSAGYQTGQRSFAGTRRPPQHQRLQMVALDLYPQRLAWTQNVLLTYEVFQAFRSEAFGQRTLSVGVRRRQGRAVKQAHILLWRRASYSKMPAAIAAFKDSTVFVGIFNPVARAASLGCTPLPSLPMMMAQGAARGASASESPARGSDAYNFRPAFDEAAMAKRDSIANPVSSGKR